MYKKGTWDIQATDLDGYGEFRITLYEISQDEYGRKAFRVYLPNQIRKKDKRIELRSDQAYGTRQSGGAPNILFFSTPGEVWKFVVGKVEEGKYYRLLVGRRFGNGPFVYSAYDPFLDGTLIKGANYAP